MHKKLSSFKVLTVGHISLGFKFNSNTNHSCTETGLCGYFACFVVLTVMMWNVNENLVLPAIIKTAIIALRFVLFSNKPVNVLMAVG